MRDQGLEKQLWSARAKSFDGLLEKLNARSEDLAKFIGKTPRDVNYWRSGAHAPNEESRGGVASYLGFSSWEDLCAYLDAWPTSSTARRMDRKTVITDTRVSTEILGLFSLTKPSGGGAVPPRVPRLSDVARAARTFMFQSDADKDQHPPVEFTYFHFIQVAAAITLQPKPGQGPRSWLLYDRTPRSDRDQYKHTQGLSLLFAVSFEIHAAGTERDPMERWLDRGADVESFLGRPGGYLRSILSEKIDFQNLEEVVGAVRASPFGLVSADQRGKTRAGGGAHVRVYSQYVFVLEGTTDATPENLNGRFSTQQINPRVGTLTVLRESEMREEMFRGEKPRLMDLVVWKSKRNNLPFALAEGGREKALFVACSDFLG